MTALRVEVDRHRYHDFDGRAIEERRRIPPLTDSLDCSGGGRVRTMAQKTDADWKETLTPEQFHVLREHGTERAGTSPLNFEKRSGTFKCAACGQPLFASDTKFESGTGWPSFYKPIEGAIATTTDTSYGMTRVEVHCAQCGGHLGHVFPDGPRPTGERYCMNGVALQFDPDTTRS